MKRIPREDAEVILRRAIELDAKENDTLSLQELHAIARELNISPRAVDLALSSHPGIEPSAAQSITPRYAPALLGPAHMAIIGAILVYLGVAIHPSDAEALTVANVAIALYALAQRNPTNRITRVVQGSAAFWVSAAVMVTLLDGPDGGVIPWATILFLVSCVVGFAAVGLRHLSEESARSADANAASNQSPPSSGGGGDSWRIRALKKIAKWLPGDPMNSVIADKLLSIFRTA